MLWLIVISDTNTNANRCNPCCSSMTMKLLFSYHNLGWNKWLEATSTNIKHCMGRILVQYCLVKSATILSQNYIKLVSRTGSREQLYQRDDKSLARPTSQCILFDGENISFDASLVIYIISTNSPPIMIINGIHETQNLLSL